MRVLPTLDQHSDQRVSPEISKALDVKGAEQFIESHPEYYACEHNHTAIQQWLAGHKVPWSLRNIEVAFNELTQDGKLRDSEFTDYKVTKVPLTPEQKGVRKSTGLVLRHSTGGIGENQLTAELPERMEELLGDTIAARKSEDSANYKLAGGAGKPVSKKLQVKYQQSLGVRDRVHPESPYKQHKGYATARATVGLNHPDLKPDSPEYNKKVSELLNK
jgi:hypothetical protein